MKAREIQVLLKKEFILEWRQRSALSGILLYVGSTIFICYLAFNVSFAPLNAVVWNALYWVIILFAAINSITKSFLQEKPDRTLYLQTLSSPQSILLAKMIYNFLLLLCMAALGLLAYMLVLGNPIQDLLIFALAVLLGTMGLSIVLTLMSSMAAKAGNNVSLMAILSFPVLIPILLNVIKMSKNAVDGLHRATHTDEILLLGAINTLVFVLSIILFPYVWKS